MNLERKKVLEMLAAGKISAEDADKLLEKLEASAPGAARDSADKDSSVCEKRPRFLRIQVDRPGGDQVNMRVPLAIMRSGTGLLAVLPTKVSERLADHGIDLSALARLTGKELDETLREINVDIDRTNGKKVRIYCE